VVGGQSLKMASPFLGGELAMRCEQSEHGESQLFVKYLCTIFAIFLIRLFYFLITLDDTTALSHACRQRAN